MDNKKTVRHRGADSVRAITVVEVKVAVGSGADDDPVRKVTEYWSMSGDLLAVNDPYCFGSMERASSRESSASM